MKIILKIFFLALTFASCHHGSMKQKASTQELRLNLHTEPPTLDPRKATDSTSINLIHMCFEGLMRLDDKGELTTGVAKEIKLSEDGKTYTFYLRDSLWSDGKAITAADFRDTWLTTLSPVFPSEFAHELFVIKNGKCFKEGKCSKGEVGIKVQSDKTLEVELEYPIPYFLELISTSYFFPTPSHIVSLRSSWAQKYSEFFVSNGPFKMTAWKQNYEVVMEKNNYYWDKEHVKLEKIHLPIIQDEPTELSMFENGELDWIGSPFSSIPLDALPTLLKKYKLDSFPIAGVYFYLFNTNVAPFNNVNFRKAFTLAIDRQAIIENILQGKQQPALSYVPSLLWHDIRDKPFFKDHDLKDAKKYFQKGIEETGKMPSVTLSYNTSEGHHKIAQAIQQQWKAAFNIDVKLENKEWKVFLDELNKHQFQVARLGGLASYDDPISFLDEGTTMRSLWQNNAYTKLLNTAMRTADQKLREEYLKEAEDILLTDMPLAPIYFYTCSCIKKPYVKGVLITKTGLAEFKYAHIVKKE